ncbi:hypothetical protein ACTI_52630 [Actinoplanes sp. OR16]|uniref:hypothetical protein n=1 Tax=Actinoplanes sp. OR16 TaxID=946334 RepID=UPI000F6EF555|nr:hypothetical protein [Actinoplanes sp. OR16]BBH68578.1 hypothetical protein ACTI_52630 [Actinoplanes sp. OR16]
MTSELNPQLELMSLREQLRALASEPAVQAAYRLTDGVKEVLEPVWTVIAGDEPTGGIGYLRSLGVADAAPARAASNDAVAKAAIDRYAALDLTAPSMGDLWSTLARPSTALVESIRSTRRDRGEGERDSLGTTVRPILPSLLLGTWHEENQVVPAVRRMLCLWCEIARHSTGERREVARLTLAAALLARGAVLDGDLATVKWFVKNWLGLGATSARLDGASAALLEQGWAYRSVDSEFNAVRDTVTDLRIEAAYQHRLHRPVWETQLAGASVTLLSEIQAVQDQTAAEDPVSAVANTLRDEQMEQVLQTLSKRERAVIMGPFSGKTHAQVQEELGMTRYEFRAIRRKTMNKLRHPSRSQVMRDYLD